MSTVSFFQNWFTKFYPSDWIALAVYLICLLGYRTFLSFMLRNRPGRLFLGKLQQYRNAWIETHSGSQESIVVVQTLRNTIMSASFLASTAILLIMGAFNLLHTLHSSAKPLKPLVLYGVSDPGVEVVKILLVIIVLSYCFFNFTWHIREINYMSFILNIPKERLDEIEGGDSTPHIAQMFLTSGLYFSLGMRGYYFLIPLMMWFFSPILLIVATMSILLILLRRDMA